MTKRMLIDATHAEETRVAVVDGSRLVDFDYESKVRKQLKGSIFLAKVTRVEPSLQAAFVNFGGNRHGFLPFSEIHPDYFRIPIADREALIAEQAAEMEALEDDEDDEEEENLSGRSEEDEEDEEDIVEELGGGVIAAIDIEDDAEENEPTAEITDEENHNTAPTPETPSSGNEEADIDSADNVSGNVAEAGEDDDAEDSIGNRREPEEDGRNDDRGNRHDGRGRRGRGRGRGRDRGGRGRHNRGRMASHSRRVEIVGGDGVDGDRPVRPSLRRNYKIQEVVKRGQIMLIQVSKEERGNKGAAVTTYLSLPGRYSVLMPNSARGGGVSRKIASFKERRRMKEILAELNVPDGMSVIMRTAGVARTKTEIKRDLDYLLRLWDNTRELTLQSTAPSLIHEEGNLIRRAIRDIYSSDIEELQVAGNDGYKLAKDFMKMMIPSHVKRVKQYKDEQMPLFSRYQVEDQISAMGEPVVTLKSGGYLVINPTEALVSIDVNSGRATKERHIEETALKTNMEAAEEVARQLRLRDLGGLVVVDFIDMEDRRNNRKVENRLKEALSSDRARIQIGRISSFGLLELSRQRLNPSLTEAQFEKCPHCKGLGHVRTIDSAVVTALRALEEEGGRSKSGQVNLHVPNAVALYILNNKRDMLADIERRYGFVVQIIVDDSLVPASYRVEPVKGRPAQFQKDLDSRNDIRADADDDGEGDEDSDNEQQSGDDNRREDDESRRDQQREGGKRRRGRRGGRRRGRRFNEDSDRQDHRPGFNADSSDDQESGTEEYNNDAGEGTESESGDHQEKHSDRGGRGRRGRGRRGRGRGRDRQHHDDNADQQEAAHAHTGESDESGESFSSVKEESRSESTKNSAEPSNDVREPPPPKDYERVNEPPTNKKKGWWSKVTE